MKILIIISLLVVLVASCTTSNPTNTKVSCPTQGIFQSQLSYCVDLCMHGKSDSGNNQDICNMVCNTGKYTGGSAELKRLIEFYKCDKCGDCTPEQLQGIEERKKQAEADAKLAYEKSIEEQRIKDKQLKVLEKLEEKINIESEKLGGYIYIKNVSGKQQNFIESGGMNHAVVPSEVIKTDLETARKLLATEQFELVIT